MCDAGLAAPFIPLGFFGSRFDTLFLCLFCDFAISVCYEHFQALDVAAYDAMAFTSEAQSVCDWALALKQAVL